MSKSDQKLHKTFSKDPKSKIRNELDLTTAKTVRSNAKHSQNNQKSQRFQRANDEKYAKSLARVQYPNVKTNSSRRIAVRYS